MARQVEDSQTSRDEEDRSLCGDAEAGALQHLAQRASRVGFFIPVGVEAQRLHHCRHQRSQERIVAIWDADDRAAARPQDSDYLAHRLLRLVEVFDGAHRVDRVEARIEKRQRPYIGSGGAQRARAARERRSRLARRRLRDVDAEGAGPVPARPGEDARVLRFVP